MNSNEARYCKKILDEMRSNDVWRIFFEKAGNDTKPSVKKFFPTQNKDKSGLSDLEAAISTRSMTVAQWTNTGKQIIQNALKLYRDDSVMYYIATDLFVWFEKKTKYVPADQESEWVHNFVKVQSQAKELLSKINF